MISRLPYLKTSGIEASSKELGPRIPEVFAVEVAAFKDVFDVEGAGPGFISELL